jgi:hypothetical protein
VLHAVDNASFMLPALIPVPSSFRDPAGFVFKDQDTYKRAVTLLGKPNYDDFMSSGLYARLVAEKLLTPHDEEPSPPGERDIAVVLVPEQIPHISYPYEWSFGQLKDAALLTLRIQKVALEHGMTLKDASAFNVQFRGPHPVFIDTLSFEKNDGGPWTAYNQFCRHFIATLLLMNRISPSFNKYLTTSLDGFPLDFTSSLLPRSTYLNFGILVHIHMHAAAQKKHAAAASAPVASKANGPAGVPAALRADPKPGFVDSLSSLVSSLEPGKFSTEWEHYYRNATHYTDAAERFKKEIVGQVLDRVKPNLVYDLGGNIGEYSRVVTSRNIHCICFDIDPMCVHHNYARARAESDAYMLPLMMDLANPTPGLGFSLTERASMVERSNADLLMALALIHHLRISANIPMRRIAQFLASLGKRLLLEFVPKSDTMAQGLLKSRKDTFYDYTEEHFQESFREYFRIEARFEIPDNSRALYLFESIKAEDGND